MIRKNIFSFLKNKSAFIFIALIALATGIGLSYSHVLFAQVVPPDSTGKVRLPVDPDDHESIGQLGSDTSLYGGDTGVSQNFSCQEDSSQYVPKSYHYENDDNDFSATWGACISCTNQPPSCIAENEPDDSGHGFLDYNSTCASSATYTLNGVPKGTLGVPSDNIGDKPTGTTFTVTVSNGVTTGTCSVKAKGCGSSCDGEL